MEQQAIDMELATTTTVAVPETQWGADAPSLSNRAKTLR